MSNSRFEIYKTYRNQIKNQDELTKIFDEGNDKINDYRMKLNSLSTKILYNTKIMHFDFLTLMTVDQSKNTEILNIQNFIQSFNKSKLIEMQDEIRGILIKFESQINDEFEQGWLVIDRGKQLIKQQQVDFENLKKKIENFRETSKVDLEKLNNILKNRTNYKDQFINFSNENKLDLENTSKRSLKRFYKFNILVGILISFSVIGLLIAYCLIK